MNLFADLSTCGLGLGKALLTDVERESSDPGGGLSRSKELLLSFVTADAVAKVIPVSLPAVSGTENGHSETVSKLGSKEMCEIYCYSLSIGIL